MGVGVQHLDDLAGHLLAGQAVEQRRLAQVAGQLIVLVRQPGLPGCRDEALADTLLRQVQHDDRMPLQQ